MDLEFYPYLPDTESFESLWEAAAEKWPDKVDEFGYVGHDGEHAYFQVRGQSEKFRLSLGEIDDASMTEKA